MKMLANVRRLAEKETHAQTINLSIKFTANTKIKFKTDNSSRDLKQLRFKQRTIGKQIFYIK
jgi:hypothetical protein